MKTKENLLEQHINFLYKEEKDNPMYAPDVSQSKFDFEAGFFAKEDIIREALYNMSPLIEEITKLTYLEQQDKSIEMLKLISKIDALKSLL